ncbi:MAG: hypothetical protein WC889_14815 [Myxococcota bacterium]|jgi:superfamily II RNA helicase
MRHKLLIVTFLCAAAVAPGCSYANGNKSVAPQLDGAVKAQESQEFAFRHKAEFVEKMKKELAELQKQLDRLSARVDRSTDTAKADAKAKLEEVREKMVLTRNILTQAEHATEETWEDVKAGITKTFGEMKHSYTDTRQWLSDKIAP